MKKFFTIFFVVLGIVFLCILIFLAYFWFTDPLNIKPFIFNEGAPVGQEESSATNSTAEVGTSPGNTTTEAAVEITPAQEAALNAVGLSSEAIPQSFTPAQLACFEGVFGKARVAEIKAGAAPTFAEFSSGQKCL